MSGKEARKSVGMGSNDNAEPTVQVQLQVFPGNLLRFRDETSSGVCLSSSVFHITPPIGDYLCEKAFVTGVSAAPQLIDLRRVQTSDLMPEIVLHHFFMIILFQICCNLNVLGTNGCQLQYSHLKSYV